MMLSAGIIGCPDDVLGPFPHPERLAQSRIVARCLEDGLGDHVAWWLIVGLEGNLGAYKAVHGNRKGKARRARR